MRDLFLDFDSVKEGKIGALTYLLYTLRAYAWITESLKVCNAEFYNLYDNRVIFDSIFTRTIADKNTGI